nr:reverse transcriptase domain-containing protein [Tanacetum cinerariifolium]
MAPKRTTRANSATPTTTTTTSVTDAQLEALIEQGVAKALAAAMFWEQWFEKMETVFRISSCSVKNQIKFSTCTLLGSALTWWNSHVMNVGLDVAYAMTWLDMKKKMTYKYCPRGEMKKLKSKLWNLRVKSNDVGFYTKLPEPPIQHRLDAYRTWGYTLNLLSHPFNIYLMPVELGSFDVIIGMDWLAKYQALIVCAEKIVRIPWGNETLIIHGNGSNRGNATRLSIISCTKTEKYVKKGFPIFLVHITTKKMEDKSKEKRLKDVPIVRDFPEVFPEDL